jgi:uncharacterized CHY-type Zn-finger protein
MTNSKHHSERPADALRNAENALRDFADVVLSHAHGKDWQLDPAITCGHCRKWISRQRAEGVNMPSGMPEERALYYADLADLLEIVLAQWDSFAPCFGKRDSFREITWLLRQYRNKGLHGRDLLAHEHHIVLGVCGLIRASITTYRTREASAMAERFFPQLEYVRDSLGNEISQAGTRTPANVLTVGAIVEVIAHAFDPVGDPIEYSFSVSGSGQGYLADSGWIRESVWSWQVTDEHVGRKVLTCQIRSTRSYHLHGWGDDNMTLVYLVVPPGW